MCPQFFVWFLIVLYFGLFAVVFDCQVLDSFLLCPMCESCMSFVCIVFGVVCSCCMSCVVCGVSSVVCRLLFVDGCLLFDRYVLWLCVVCRMLCVFRLFVVYYFVGYESYAVCHMLMAVCCLSFVVCGFFFFL